MRRAILFGFGLWFMAGSVAQVALAVPEVEPNNSFADRQILSPGESTLEADLADAFASFDESRDGVLAEGAVDSWNFTATPGTPFTAWIDNLVVDPGPNLPADTVLGEFDALGNLVDSNDDTSPFGDGFASALAGVANPDGTIRLKVTGWPDFDFDGQDDEFPQDPHFESGAYTLFVRIGEAPDVDYVTFTGLTPGEVFDVEIVAAEFDTVMGRFDDSGALIDFNDDQDGVSTRSRLGGDVPPNGQLHVAISLYEDLDLDGEIEVEPGGVGGPDELGDYSFGAYDLVVRVPEPGTRWLAASALTAIVALTRRRGRRDILP